MTWIAGSLLVLCAALAVAFGWYERSRPSARVLALVAALAALAALGRIAFAPIPNVKPTTDIAFLTGFAFGGAPAFAVGAIAALASNVFFGQGPWTPWEMVGWGLTGLMGAGLARLTRRRARRLTLALACGLAGLVYGAVMNVSLWVTYSGDHTAEKLWAVFATSLPFDLAHAIGNVAFCLAFGPALVGAISRYRRRFTVTWLPREAPVAAAPLAGALVVVALALGATAPAARATAVPRAPLQYLIKAQNRDGGFGAAPGRGSDPLFAGWAALGLAASGRDLRGSHVLAYVRAHARQLSDPGAYARTLLVAGAAHADPRAFGGRDLVAALGASRARDGSFAHRVNTTAFAILGLRAIGWSPRNRTVARAATWIARRQHRDGGFNFGGSAGSSGIDDSASAIEALVAAGRRRSRGVRRAATFLARHQNRDGGFALQVDQGSNAQSTAFAIQGLVAAGRHPSRMHRGGARSPLEYLRSLIGPDGAVRYSRTTRQTPVWVTAQSLAALALRPLPLSV